MTWARSSTGGLPGVGRFIRRAGKVTWPPVMAATSRAMPSRLMASGRFVVTSMSRMTSSRPRTLVTSAPSSASGGSTRMPEWSSATPSSRAEHSIPSETSPRIVARPIVTSPGRRAPGRATGTLSPTLKLWAPHTMRRDDTPVVTSTTSSLSALGWGMIAVTSPTTTPSMSAPGRWMASTFSPAAVSAAARESASRSMTT